MTERAAYTLVWSATQQRFPLPPRGSVVIGRDETADVRVPVPTVSTRHARMWWQDGRWWVEDLGSTNGTFLNGQRVTRAQPLQPGDELRLGRQVVLHLEGPLTKGGEQPQTTTRTPTVEATLFGEQAAVLLERAERDTQPSPWLLVQSPADSLKSYLLTQPEISLGSGPHDTIRLPPPFPTRYARLLRDHKGDYQWEALAPEPAPLLNGKPAPRHFVLQNGDVVHLPLPTGQAIEMRYHRPRDMVLGPRAEEILFGQRNTLTIGRAPDNDVVLDSPVVSRRHAIVRKEVAGHFVLQDLNTPNGTFVNGRRVRQARLKPGDQIQIGPYRFIVGGQGLTSYRPSQGLWVAALRLTHEVRDGQILLHDISLVIEAGEMVVIVGQSGSGKTTLLNALSGFEPATHGEVIVDGVHIYHNFDAMRHHIGYVPQRDILHKELTVWEALDFAARLRMPPDTSTDERQQRIQEVLTALDLDHRRHTPIRQLSGGQQKRVSIGVELLTRPGLFFLDEPTSGLDPGTESVFMRLLRELTDQGRTIILVTHTTKNIHLADKVVFLARGGYLAWYGPPDEALAYFERFRTPEERRQGELSFDDIYLLLDDPQRGTPQAWAQRFRQHEAYTRYIREPLARKRRFPLLDSDAQASLMLALDGVAPETAPPPAARGPKRPPISRGIGPAWHQTRVLLLRNLRVLMRDTFGLILMLLVAPLVGSLDFILAALLGRRPFDFFQGDFSTAMVSLFSLTIYAVMVGSLSQMREIVKERDIYRRERLVNLRRLPYVAAKFAVAVLLAFYQAAWYVILHYAAFQMPGGWYEGALVYGTLVLTALSGMMLGLLASALAPNANTAPLIVILFMVPQIVLSGVQIPLPQRVSALSSTRWGFEALMSITGIGADVAADACWRLPLQTRALMTVEDKTALCRCMGLNLLQPEQCAFPGLGKYAVPDAKVPPPVAPLPPGDPPTAPELPPPPPSPTPPADSVTMAQYLNQIQAYQREVEALQQTYQAELALYQSRVEIYQAQLYAYQQAYLRWEMRRAMALGPAEGMLEHVWQDYGWTFVPREAPYYQRKIFAAWRGQGVLIGLFLIAVWGTLTLREKRL